MTGEITVLSREDGSGTRGAFIELFGIEQKNDAGEKEDMTTDDAQITNSTSVMMTTVQGNPKAIEFPRAMMHSGDMRFSLSGLKTAVVTYINNERAAGRELNVPNICASFEAAVVDVQVKKAEMALRETGAPTFCLGGGVAANPVLRAAYEKLCKKMQVRLVMPPLSACGDNAGMIALVALDRFRQGKFYGLETDAQAHADLEQEY